MLKQLKTRPAFRKPLRNQRDAAETRAAILEAALREFAEERPGLQQFSMSSRVFLNDGKMYRAGETLRQPELAATLERIAKNGPEEFYRGETAQMLARDMNAMGGLITLDDLAHYQPKVREVLRGSYSSGGERWEVLSAPPPSSGGVAAIECSRLRTG